MKKQPQKNKPTEKRATHPLSGTHYNSTTRFSFVGIFLLFALFLTFYKNDFYLKWAEDLSFFAPTWSFFLACMKFPGGLLTYGGTFLTQFFYYPLLGSLLFIALLLVVQHLTIKAFRIPPKYFPLSFIPGIMLLLSITQLGYVWMTLKSPGYFFSNTLGVIAVLLFFPGYTGCNKIRYRIPGIAGIIIAGYPLLGFYALFAAFLCILHELRFYVKGKSTGHFVPITTGVLLMLAVPQFCYYFIFNYTQYTYIYMAGLPRFLFNSDEWILWLPFVLLFVSLVAFLFMPFASQEQKPANRLSVVFSAMLFIASLFAAYTLSYDDENFRAEVKMNAAIEQNDWRRVITIAKNQRGKPTRNVVLNNNLAAFKFGAANAVLDINHTVATNSVRPGMALVHFNSRFLFYHYGEINDSYRWCMEDMVEYGLKSSTLKCMVKCAILNEEYELARKYNALLLDTWFYRNWAEKYQSYIDNPALAEQDEEMKTIRLLIAEKALTPDG